MDGFSRGKGKFDVPDFLKDWNPISESHEDLIILAVKSAVQDAVQAVLEEALTEDGHFRLSGEDVEFSWGVGDREQVVWQYPIKTMAEELTAGQWSSKFGYDEESRADFLKMAAYFREIADKIESEAGRQS